jgi:hypothetical protein
MRQNLTMRNRTLMGIGLALWPAGFAGLLYLGTLPGDLGQELLGDVLCGPWG